LHSRLVIVQTGVISGTASVTSANPPANHAENTLYSMPCWSVQDDRRLQAGTDVLPMSVRLSATSYTQETETDRDSAATVHTLPPRACLTLTAAG
jgi:hypothetical protein